MPTAIPDGYLPSGQAFDSLPQASFFGVPFPVSKIELTCSLRDHIHEYPHSPGGAPEKLGRKLYEIHLTVPAYQGLAKYPTIWPDDYTGLRQRFETGKSGELVIPTVGTITAYCTSWREVADPKTGRNGITAELTFREDQADLFLVSSLIAQTSAGFGSNLAAYQQALDDQQARLADAYAAGVAYPDVLLLTSISASDLSLLTAVITAANLVTAALAEAASFGFAVAMLAEALVTTCQQADQASLWADPTYYPLLYALHDLWQNAQQLATDALSTGVRVVHYTVPQPGLGIGAISTAIYGDASHSIELLETNEIYDPFFVPGGTVLKAYLFAPQTQGAT